MPIEVEYKDKKINVGEGLEDCGEVYITGASLLGLSETGIYRLQFVLDVDEKAIYCRFWSGDKQCFCHCYFSDRSGTIQGALEQQGHPYFGVFWLGPDRDSLVTIGKPGKEQVIIRYID